MVAGVAVLVELVVVPHHIAELVGCWAVLSQNFVAFFALSMLRLVLLLHDGLHWDLRLGLEWGLMLFWRFLLLFGFVFEEGLVDVLDPLVHQFLILHFHHPLVGLVSGPLLEGYLKIALLSQNRLALKIFNISINNAFPGNLRLELETIDFLLLIKRNLVFGHFADISKNFSFGVHDDKAVVIEETALALFGR